MVELQSSLCKKLQPDVTHRSRLPDDVASAGEEQVDVPSQLPGAAEVERYVGTPAALFRRIAEHSAPSVNRSLISRSSTIPA